jgi:hypothetical protein
MKKYFVLIPIILFFIATSQIALAQEKSVNKKGDRVESAQDSINENTKLVWISGGVGTTASLFGWGLEATYSWGSQSITGGSQSISAKTISVTGWGNGGPLREFGFFYGSVDIANYALDRIAIGLTYFSGTDEEYNKLHTFGLSAEVEGMLKVSSLGIGLMLTGDAVPHHIYGGVFLNLSFGKLN